MKSAPHRLLNTFEILPGNSTFPPAGWLNLVPHWQQWLSAQWIMGHCCYELGAGQHTKLITAWFFFSLIIHILLSFAKRKGTVIGKAWVVGNRKEKGGWGNWPPSVLAHTPESSVKGRRKVGAGKEMRENQFKSTVLEIHSVQAIWWCWRKEGTHTNKES